MSRRSDRLREFFDWLVAPHNDPKPDSQWKRQQVKALVNLIERTQRNVVMRPNKDLDDAIILLRRAVEKIRRGTVFAVSESDSGRKGREKRGFLATGKLKLEEERRFLAVLAARCLYPDESAYEKVRIALEQHGIHYQTATLRQKSYRFRENLKGERTQAIFNVAFAHYGQFRCEKLTTRKRRSKPLSLSASESDLLRRIAEGWQLTFRKNK